MDYEKELKKQLGAVAVTLHKSSSHEHQILKLGIKRGLYAFGLLVSVFAISTLFYGFRHPLGKTFVAGTEIKKAMPAVQIEKLLESKTRNYKFRVQSTDGKINEYYPADAGIEIDHKATASSVILKYKNQSYFDHLKWWRRDTVPLKIKFDATKFATFNQTKVTSVQKPAKNAQLVIDSGTVSLVAEENGQGEELLNAQTATMQAVRNLSASPLKLSKGQLKPAILGSNLTDIKLRIESILLQNVEFKISSSVIKASPVEIGSWIELTPVEYSHTIDVNINEGKILEYMNSISRPYVRPPKSQVVIKRDDGSLGVLVSGRNGIDVENKQALATDAGKKILTSAGLNMDLPVRYANFNSIIAQSYPKWIEVDTTNKRMYAYSGGIVVNSFLISAGAPATPTVLGQFAIYSKQRIQNMRGLNADGSRYFQPDVEWVNYFYADYAIHGNYWRPTNYFGNINSSHGCVGIVNSDAEWIYNWAPVGTPVIVHD